MLNGGWRGAGLGGLLCVLAACGGSYSDDRAVKLTATDDAVSVAWRVATDIDVLANDQASRGTLRIAQVAPPREGSVQVVDGLVRYTPRPGWFGQDRFSYTVQGDDGRLAQATVSVEVEARLTVAGVVADGARAGATVELEQAGVVTSVVADEAGRFQMPVAGMDTRAGCSPRDASPRRAPAPAARSTGSQSLPPRGP